MQALWYKMYAVGSGVLASAVAVCSHYGPKVGQGVVGGLTAVSGVPFVLFLCVLSMMLAAATVIGWRLRMNCWVKPHTLLSTAVSGLSKAVLTAIMIYAWFTLQHLDIVIFLAVLYDTEHVCPTIMIAVHQLMLP